MKKTLYISILLVFASLGLAKAQHSAFTIEIPVTVPMGKTADFIDQTGIRGINLEYQRFIKPQFAIGGEIGHTTLYKREENKVYTEGSASLSGIQYRYQYAYPILITGTYFPITEGEIKPYVGVGLGTMAQKRRVDMGIFTSENTHWQFALRPEAGIMIEPSPQVAFKLGVKYYNSFESTDLNGQSNLGINVGLVFLR
ncbi:outer membrane beta-barrel protein [Algoriphagus zhangzhouensis]|uniref:Outer membrane protein beta-barrel domain-containing protein n=1 Tax=Algoriphagus zhangzhouensis TaxID=1073327 RepID=A0A1M7ZHQ7_9BACT|nr:outer membrane beta-barrel protein [Algoriphagus zhangzhouensis]TDY44191.1 outer membrane protein with beta-barrel domain [Algoriphagus zhangzhouensis]SHO64359.1 Outer membrane protein beta-barrel domain-containing protein [Algoriphagus zhangzhouensis]